MTTTYSTEAPANFIADYDKMMAKMAPFALTHPTGFMYLSDDAPAQLVRLYHSLTSYGFANGHFN